MAKFCEVAWLDQRCPNILAHELASVTRELSGADVEDEAAGPNMLKASPRIYLDLKIGFTKASCLASKLTIASRQEGGTVNLDFEVIARPASWRRLRPAS